MARILDPRHFKKWTEAPETGCWIWGGATNNDGFPVVNARDNQHVVAARWLWQAYIAPLPARVRISPICLEHLCVSPHHRPLEAPQRVMMRTGQIDEHGKATTLEHTAALLLALRDRHRRQALEWPLVWEGSLAEIKYDKKAGAEIAAQMEVPVLVVAAAWSLLTLKAHGQGRVTGAHELTKRGVEYRASLERLQVLIEGLKGTCCPKCME